MHESWAEVEVSVDGNFRGRPSSCFKRAIGSLSKRNFARNHPPRFESNNSEL